MVTDEISISESSGSVAESVANEARFQRRKSGFRRRLISVLIGLTLVVGIALWQRERSVLQQCESSLAAYGRAASATQLDLQPKELIEANWLELDVDASHANSHYEVLVRNWLRRPAAGDAIPIAMCAEAHSRLTGGGRFVLFRTEAGDLVRWVDEDEAFGLSAISQATLLSGE